MAGIVYLILAVIVSALLIVQTIRVKDLTFRLSEIRWDRNTAWNRADELEQENTALEQELAAQKSAPNLQQELNDLKSENAEHEKLALEQFNRNKRLRDQIISLEAKLNQNNHQIADLKMKATLKSESKLTEAMSGLCRFIAANQWMLEKNKELRDSLESVREVSNSVESFRTDF